MSSTPPQEDVTTVVRFAASKVAAVIGLHEFGDATDDFLEVRFAPRCSRSLTLTL